MAVAAVAACLLLAVGVSLAEPGAWSPAALPRLALLGVAAALGWVFQANSFGYASAFRAWMTRGDGSGLAAGVLVAAVAALVIVPVSALSAGYGGYVQPLGPPAVVGAALFGLGMQLGNGCASGTLYAAGGGSRRMWVVLPFFCAGGVLGSLILPAALELPSLPPVGLGEILGPWGGLAATLALTGALAALLLRRGPWPSTAQVRAALAIGALAALAFLLSGQPWGVTSGLTLWGAKAAGALRLDLGWSTYWSWAGPRQDLAGSLLAQDFVADGYRIHPWRDAGRFLAWPVPGTAMAANTRRGGGGVRGIADGHRRAACLRLQYRRDGGRHIVGQPARIPVVLRRSARLLARHPAAPPVRGRGRRSGSDGCGKLRPPGGFASWTSTKGQGPWNPLIS